MDSFDVLLVDLRDLGCRIYLHHHAALRARSGPPARQGGLGARPPPTPPAARSRADPARRLGELRRRRPDADAPRPDHGRTRPLVHRHAQGSTSTAASSKCRAGSPMPPPATAGRSANGPGSTPARTPPTCGWPAYAGTVMLRHDAFRRARHDALRWKSSAPRTSTPAPCSPRCALAPHWLAGCRLREIWFEPTFHKHAGKLCHGLQIHVGTPLQPRRLPPLRARPAWPST